MTLANPPKLAYSLHEVLKDKLSCCGKSSIAS